ncbi:MAG: hypothetical protein EBU97_02455, partial [Rhodobacteraceae bacterium]|nr:hypothetical protein [Paracoccaceae bacterium]
FVPVLSQEPESSSWQGLRGLVVDTLAEHTLPDSHAYLCGPPPMTNVRVWTRPRTAKAPITCDLAVGGRVRLSPGDPKRIGSAPASGP